MCVCVCVYVQKRRAGVSHAELVYAYLFVCVCVRACERGLASISLSGIIPYANLELIPPPFSKYVSYLTEKISCEFQAFPLRIVKLPLKKLDGNTVSIVYPEMSMLREN